MVSTRSANSQSTPRRYTTRPLSRTALLLVGTLGLTACGPGYDDPNDAAEQFANHLESEQLEALNDTVLADGSIDPEAVHDATSALADFPLSVTLESATVDEDEQNSDDEPVTATAEYTVQWDLSGSAGATGEQAENTDSNDEDTAATPQDTDQHWTYTTDGTLIWDDESEAWQPHLEADTLIPGLAEGGQVVVSVDAAQRGDILDTHGEPLATERPVQNIGIDKAHVAEALAAEGSTPSDDELDEALTSSATDLAEALELDAEPFVERVLAAGERAWVEFIVLRDDGETDIPSEQIEEIPGAASVADTMVLGPTATFAPSLLGSYGQPSAEDIDNSEGEFAAGVETGLSGLQRTYNSHLAGTDGLDISVDNSAATDSNTPDSTAVEFSRAATDGTSITMTIDMQLQELAEQIIHESEEPAGLVVIRPSDGHILAAAEGPEELTWPLAMTASYAPGSTFKVVTALAMLRNGLTPESTVECPSTLNVDGQQIANFEQYPSQYVGEITLADAVAQSCNTTFVAQHDEISPQQLHDAGAALGLVADPVVGFEGAFLGSIPTDIEGTTHAAGLFGQGSVAASPLGMATVAASVAAGETVTPTLMSEPGLDPTDNEELPVDEPLSSAEAEQLRELMAGPVEYGTVPILQDVPGATVLAKTGTAESEADGEAIAHTWLMAIQDDIAVASFVHDGVGGAQTNGPVVQEFLTELQGLNPAE